MYFIVLVKCLFFKNFSKLRKANSHDKAAFCFFGSSYDVKGTVFICLIINQLLDALIGVRSIDCLMEWGLCSKHWLIDWAINWFNDPICGFLFNFLFLFIFIDLLRKSLLFLIICVVFFLLAAKAEKPSYSENPSYSATGHNEPNFYYSASDEQVDEMKYDPVANWKVDTASGFAPPPVPAPPAPTIVKEESQDHSSPPISTPAPQNLTAAATIRNRFVTNDPLIPLGRKATPASAAGPATGKVAPYSTAAGTLKRALSPGAATTASSAKPSPVGGPSLPRQKLPAPSADHQAKPPVKKKAKFGRSAEDDEELVETKPVIPPPKVRRDSAADQAEIMRTLFGDEDDEDDDMGVELPIEMYVCFIKSFTSNLFAFLPECYRAHTLRVP